MRLFIAPLRAAIFSFSLVGFAAAVPSARAQTTTYTDAATFLANVQPNPYTETFTGTGTTTGGSTGTTSTTGFAFTGNGYSYTITAPAGSSAYRSGTFASTLSANQALTITFTSGNVTALGGNFFNTNAGNTFQATPVTITLSNGTTTSYTPTSLADYRGFTTSAIITSLTLSAPGASLYTAVDNLTVGTRIAPAAAPEPGTFALVGMGIVPLMGVVARRRKTA